MIFFKLLFFIFIILFVAIVFGAGLILSFVRRLLGGSRSQSVQDRRAGRSHSSAGKGGVTDHRDPAKANRKIFSKEEGEYVDFTEE